MPDRMIRASICSSDTLNELSDFEERFWHRLIVNCDDFGRFDARPAILKGSLFPLAEGKTKKDMTDALNKLASVGLVELYTVDGKPFLHVVTWSKYQRTRAAKSKFPAPEVTCCQMTADVPVVVVESESVIVSDNRKSEAETTRTREPALTAVSDPDWARVAGFLVENIDQRPSPRCLGDLKGYLRDFGPDLCVRVMEEAMEHGQETRKWAYIDKIFKRLYAEGIKTVEDFERRKEDGQSGTTGGGQNPRPRLPGITYL